MYTKKVPILLAALVFWLSPGLALAQSGSERLAIIQSKCQVAHDNLDLLRRRDLVARTNRGREYENIVKQLEAFTQRVRHNRLDAGRLGTTTQQFKIAVDQFRDAYLRYDDSLSELLQTDCRTKPDVFALKLEESRVLRAETAVSATRAEELALNYRELVATLAGPNINGAAQ